jgi:hypothetical protein
MSELLPGDVVVLRTGGRAGAVIRFGEWLQHQPDLRNHVAVLHHIEHDVRWYLEGRPGGVGWKAYPVSRDPYKDSPYTIDNSAQPKTDAQRELVTLSMRKLLGAPYDWEAIEADAAQCLHMPDLWKRWAGGQMPGHVVCSSSAAWAYSEAHLAGPAVITDQRLIKPSDWDLFIESRGWTTAVS